MNSTDIALLGSLLTTALVITVPLVQSVINHRFERRQRMFETEMNVRRAVYEEFLSIAGHLSTTKVSDRSDFISCAGKVCLYCGPATREIINRLVYAVEFAALYNNDALVLFEALEEASDRQANIDGAKLSPGDRNYIIFRISECFDLELDALRLQYSGFIKRTLVYLRSKIQSSKAKVEKKEPPIQQKHK